MRTFALLFLVILCAKPVLVTAGVPASRNTVQGWRGDGSGHYPEAKPPTEWSKDSPHILWKFEAGKGVSSPVFSKGKLFFTAEPSQILCLDAENGQELWRSSAGYAEALGKKEAARIADQHQQLDQQRRAINQQFKQLREANPDSPQLEPLKEQRKQIENKRRSFERQFPREKRGGAGNAAATVVCDGQRVFAVFGTGIVGAYDYQGKQLWITRLEDTPKQGFGHASSPLLTANRLIVHIDKLTALDPASGEQVWQQTVPAKFGTAVLAQIENEAVIVTPSGFLVATENGKILAEKQFQMSNNSPLLHQGVLYVHERGKVRALKLPETLSEPVKFTQLWETTGTREERMASALYHAGLLYSGGRRGILDVYDAVTGKRVYQRRSEIGELFASPSRAGNLIFWPGKNGRTLILQPGRTFEEVAVNSSERISATPCFHETRMFLRTDRHLYCVGK